MAAKLKTWKCQGCKKRSSTRKRKCEHCGRAKPKRKPPAHKDILKVPYEKWAELYGHNCNICGKEPNPERRHDRDHDHKSGVSRGILCVSCNRPLTTRLTPEWLRKAADYLDRADGPERLSFT